jgi:hypothetical protein
MIDRDRIKHGGTQTLKTTEGNKLPDAVRHAAEQRARREHDQANLEHTPPPEAI